MVKLYKRYKEEASFGIISSGLVLEKDGECITSSLSNIVSWNIKQATSTTLLTSDRVVTCIAKSQSIIAVGFSDGSIRLIGSELVVLNGHRVAVTALCFDQTGTRLASGSSDTDIVLWDVVSEEGLYRFKGHKDQITCLEFLENDYLISGSKDTLIKIWDIDARFCVENIVSHRGEVWCLAIKDDMLLTGCSDGLLRAWKLDTQILRCKLTRETERSEIIKAVTLEGKIERLGSERILNIRFHPTLNFFGVQGNDKMLEIFKLRDLDEIQKVLKRKQKKAIKKGLDLTNGQVGIADKIISWSIIRGAAKIKSFDFSNTHLRNVMRLFLGMSNNSIEIFNVDIEDSGEQAEQFSCIELPGHRTDIRTVALNDDDSLIASGSSDRIKVYAASTKSCLHTLISGYALCCAFLPGSKHIVVGTKTGDLQLFELSSSSMIESLKAHDGPIWSMHSLPDKSGIVTGSQDKQVKFWSFALIADQDYSLTKKRASLVHTRTLKLSDDVLSVRVSPNGQLLAVSLLDLTVKVFYIDSLKFFLSLYGHKLPVVAMDISFDSRIIITASSDKTVKIWGLDFGDCHKSILAHQDAVMACQFVWGTYYFFTASKDRTLKYFDGEKFEEISELTGHHGEVWALAVGKYGNMVVSASHDKSIRTWEKTDDQFVLSEEREEILEKIYEGIDLGQDFSVQDIGSKAENAAEQTEIREELATKATKDSLKAGELLADALIAWSQEIIGKRKYLALKQSTPELALPVRHPLVIQMGLSHLSPEEFVLSIISKIRPSNLNDSLLTLPFSSVAILLECIAEWTKKKLEPITTSKVLLFLLKFHHDEIVANLSLKQILEFIRSYQNQAMKEIRDKIGFNVYGMNILLREFDEQALDYLPIEDQEGIQEIKGTKRRLKIIS